MLAGGASAFSAENSHPILHFLRDAIVAHDRPRVSQATAFALDQEAPKCMAGIPHQFRPRFVGPLPAAVVLGERGKRHFKDAAQSPERGCLFLRYFVVECDHVIRTRSVTRNSHLRPIEKPSAPPRYHRHTGGGIEFASRFGLKAAARQHVFWRGIGADFGEDRKPAGDRDIRNARQMERIVER